MIQTLVAVLMWALVVSLLVLRRKRGDRSIAYAAVTIALAMTLNLDEGYVAVDTILGGTNLATPLSDGLLMVGVFFLGRGIMKAGQYQPGPVRVAVGRPMLLAALVALAVSFVFIDRGTTTTTFMRDLGAQPAAAAYSIIEFTYAGLVISAMMLLAVGQLRDSRGIQRLPALLLLVGSGAGVALCITVLVMDVAHVLGTIGLMTAVGGAYEPLSLATFAFLCVGLAAQPGLRWARDHARRVQTARLLDQLELLWKCATGLRPGLSQALPRATDEDLEDRLHRAIVEVRDAMIDRRISFYVDDADEALLERAENHLLGQSPASGSVDDSFSFSHRDLKEGLR